MSKMKNPLKFFPNLKRLNEDQIRYIVKQSFNNGKKVGYGQAMGKKRRA